MKSLGVKSLSLVITFGILLLLFLSGPAQAFTIGFDILNNKVDRGEVISFIGKVDILSNEHLPIDYLELSLDGPETVVCKFLSNGTVISGCKGITMTSLGTSNYGYGYGYGYGHSNGKLIYHFRLDTTDYDTGSYSTMLTISMNGNNHSEIGSDININKKISSSTSGGGTRTIYRDKIIYKDKIEYVDKDYEEPVTPEPVTPEPVIITNTEIENKTPWWMWGIIFSLIIAIGVIGYYLSESIKHRLPEEDDEELLKDFE